MNTKRMREEEEEVVMEGLDMARCLMLLSNSGTLALQAKPIRSYRPPSDVFECKTCNRRFSSFQALGGHRASHKKPRLVADHDHLEVDDAKRGKIKKKHECTICGVVFTMGQALGGHMRRHRAVALDGGFAAVPAVSKGSMFLKRSGSMKGCGWLDLNLTPLENDLKLLFGKMAPTLDSFV
ncbi:hypothetical protein UlMin_005980 [Ulmus minor]